MAAGQLSTAEFPSAAQRQLGFMSERAKTSLTREESMKPLHAAFAACLSLLATVGTASAQPQHEAITQYKAFMAAVRAGKSDEAMKLVEPVPKDAASLVTTALRFLIVDTALKTEVAAQMGAYDPKDEDYLEEALHAPEVLENLKVQPRLKDIVLLRATDPRTRTELTLVPMILRDGKWLVPAATLGGMQLEFKPGATSELPPPKLRQQIIEHTEAETKAFEAVLKRLKNKEFKTRDDVVKALSDAMPKPDAEVDIDEC